MKYIDAEKLKELLGAKYKEFREKGYRKDATYYYFADGLDVAKQLVESLQQEQPNVDLDEEMDRYFETMEIKEHENIFESTFKQIAKHFFKLGLKAIKEKN